MSQTKLESHIEATLNIASGFILSYAVWRWFVNPMMDAGFIVITDYFLITIIFTVTSYIRSYLWRRFFNSKGK